MKGMLKWPAIVAAVVVVLRVVLEQSGAPETVNNLISVAALTVLICPVYFALRIGQASLAHPYLAQVKATALFAALARAMVLPTYWLGRIYGWPQSRFYGLSGPDVTPFTGFIAIPFATAAFWIVASVTIGGALGSVIIAIMRKAGGTPEPAGSRGPE